MTIRIIVPHRGLEHAKTRLAAVLEPDERADLAERLLRHVLTTAVSTGHEVVVISPDPALSPAVAATGAVLSVQRGMGLNTGLRQARGEALAAGVTLIAVLHGDLPDLTAADVTALIAAAGGAPAVAIAPDAAGRGTNGLALSPPDVIDFAFGPDSFAAHRAAGEESGVALAVVKRAGLAFDLDTPDDLAAWLERGDAA